MKLPLPQVLVVEDDLDFAVVLLHGLQLIGAEATLASTGEEALETVRQRRFDLIILDVRLPGISGLEVCRQLKMDPAQRGIPVIFSSGDPGAWLRDAAFTVGAADYLLKPYGVEDFKTRVLAQLPKP